MTQAGAISKAGKPSWSSAACDADCYPDGMVATNVVKQIRHAAMHPEARPFFIAAGLKRPHLGWFAPSYAYDKYPNNTESVPLASNRTPSVDVPLVSLGNNGEMSGMDDVKTTMIPSRFGGEFRMVPDWKQHELRRAYYAAASFMDQQLGRILGSLV